MGQGNWEELVNLIYSDGNNAPIKQIKTLLGLEPTQEMEALAARANATRIVRMLHDPASQLMDMIMKALSDGKLCVVDVSQISARPSLVLSGLILRRIFDRNQAEFTEAEPKTIPTIAVIEEAQTVLNEKAVTSEPYIQWVKEGRKYDLGAVLVTQQPGSIPFEILSQGDNWFLFHLLSAGDLRNVQAANAHFGQDILSTLLNETIPGQGAFWSSVGGKQYPVPLRVLSFEALYRPLLDERYDRPSIPTYANEIQKQIRNMASPLPSVDSAGHQEIVEATSAPVDALTSLETRTINALKNSEHFSKIKEDGMAWGAIKAFFLKELPEHLDDREQFAYHLVEKAMKTLFGEADKDWESFKHKVTNATWVRAIPK